MIFINKVKSILFKPNDCWTEIGKEKGIADALKYLLILIPISAVLYFFIGLLSLKFAKPDQITAITDAANLLGLSLEAIYLIVTIGIFLLFFIGLFLNSFLIQLFMKMFKGQGTFADTYKAFSYGATPQFLLMGIPYVNQVSYFYMTYLQLQGLSKFHKVSIWKAVLATVFAYAILLILIIVPIFFLFSHIYSTGYR